MATLPPPPPAKPHRPSTDEGIVEENAFSVSAARALFEAAKRPEVQKAATTVAKNPVLRNAAINAAKDPTTRNAALSALQNSNNVSTGRPAPPPKKPLPGGGDAPPPPPPHRGASGAPTKPKPVYKEPSFELAPPAPSISSYNRALPALPPKDIPKPSYHGSIVDELKSLHISTSGPSYNSSPSTYSTPSSNSYNNVVVPPKPTRPPPPKPARTPPAPTTEPHAVVRYPFTASQADELNCQEGDTILLKKEVDDQWIYGLNTRTGKQGIIPIGFVDVRIPLAPTATGHKAVAMYDFFSGTPGDLQFRAHDTITVVEWASPDWLFGHLHGQSGIFPVSYVSCQTLHAVPFGSTYNNQPAGPIGIFYALYDYNSGVDGDLIFRAGDEIEVMEYVGQDWVRGRLHGMEGLLPFTYVSSQQPKKSPGGLASIASIGTTQARLYMAMDDHHSDDPSNLYFSKGDRLIVVEEVDEHFYRGKLEEFKTLPPGLIPRSKALEL